MFMRLSGILPVLGRRVVVALGVAGMLLVASSVQAQTAPAAAAAQPEPPDTLKFGANLGGPILLMLQIKPGQEATFEEAWATIKAGLAASAKPELQAQAKTMNLLKLNSEMPADVPRPYVVILDPPNADTSYDFVKMLYYSGAWKADDPEVRKQIDAIYEKVKASLAMMGVWTMGRK
jgi:hypothetical protein